MGGGHCIEEFDYKGEGSQRGRWESLCTHNILGGHEQFDYISVNSSFSIHNSRYYTILCVSVAGSVDVVARGGWLVCRLVKFKKKEIIDS